MTREDAIHTIERLYPADNHDYTGSGDVGRELLAEARDNCWWDESDTVLEEYARLCIERDTGILNRIFPGQKP